MSLLPPPPLLQSRELHELQRQVDELLGVLTMMKEQGVKLPLGAVESLRRSGLAKTARDAAAVRAPLQEDNNGGYTSKYHGGGGGDAVDTGRDLWRALGL